jgi:hypothetical protein
MNTHLLIKDSRRLSVGVRVIVAIHSVQLLREGTTAEDSRTCEDFAELKDSDFVTTVTYRRLLSLEHLSIVLADFIEVCIILSSVIVNNSSRILGMYLAGSCIIYHRQCHMVSLGWTPPNVLLAQAPSDTDER